MTRQGKTHLIWPLMFAVATSVFAGGGWADDDDGFFQLAGLSGFDGVENRTPAEVVIYLDADHAVRARGDEKVLNRYIIDVSDGRLLIRDRPWPFRLLTLLRDNDVLVEVSMPNLSFVRTTGSGGVRVEGAAQSDSLELRTTGPGGILASGDSQDLTISISGSGDIDFTGSSADAHLRLSGPGNLELDLEAGAIEAAVTGSGDIGIRGSAGEVEVVLRGPGRFDGDGFTAASADITISGSGDATLAVENELSARLTASGDIQLTGGSPAINSRVTGSGRVLTPR